LAEQNLSTLHAYSTNVSLYLIQQKREEAKRTLSRRAQVRKPSDEWRKLGSGAKTPKLAASPLGRQTG